MNITLVSGISTIGVNIQKCTELFEIFRMCLPDLPGEILYVHPAFLFGYNFDKSLMTIMSNIGEKTSDALILFKTSEDYVL